MGSLRAICALFLIASLGAAKEPSARELFRRGRTFEKAGNVAQAYLLYSQAAAADPGRREYAQRAEALQRKAITEANAMPSVSGGASVLSDPLIEPSPEDRTEASRLQPPVELDAKPGRQDFNLRGDRNALWEQISRAFGLDIVFDGDYQPGESIRFAITGADHREALHALMSATSSFIVPVGPKLMLVAQDTEQKRRDVENTMALSVPIPDPVSLQDAQEMARAVQQVMEIQKFGIDSAQRVVLLRDRVSKVIPAQALLRQMMLRRPEVLIELELVAVPKNTSLSFGLGLPTTYPLTALIETISLAGGPLSFALTLGTAELLAKFTQTTSTTLLRAQLRSVDGMPATFHSGEKYPILTMGFVGDVGGADPSEVYRPPPSFTFEDLGLSLKITPKIHDLEDVTLEIEAEYKLLTGSSLNGNPVISNRKFTTRATLRFDQWAIIAGLVDAQTISTKTGIAGLSSIPILGTALSRNTRDRAKTETLLVLKPRLLSLPPSEVHPRPIWIGSESRLRHPL